jgi:molecular chaperone GrpE (heat shock protein)
MFNDLFNTIFSKSNIDAAVPSTDEKSTMATSTDMVHRSELDEAMNDYRRLKNRFDKTVAEQSKSMIKSFANKIISIIADFESGSDIISQMIVNKLKALLATYNIVPMGVSVGDAFNVKKHNAVRQDENVATTDDNAIMVVASVMRDGYVMDDEVISYAMVSVKPWCRTENTTTDADEANTVASSIDNYVDCL